MIANHIYHALEQVRELQQKILERQRFKGYSGRVRAICGTTALLAAAIMSSHFYPQTVKAHIYGWGLVFLFGFLLNYGAMIHWFLFDPMVKRDIRRLKPTLDALPALFVGGILTATMIMNGDYRYLFGIWMTLFGVANLASRHVLPRRIWIVGVYYIIAGSICLLSPSISFLNPWVMGIVFFIGEWTGGVILHFDGEFPISPRELIAFLFNHKESKHAEQI
ncbi:MAG: hypothetical protein GXO78_10710 [Calditrichaeota bacterium]|nr:hypothetical protein [Calditrichota bacterium]